MTVNGPSACVTEVAVLTHTPSPYQVELFDEVERVKPGWISVYYLHRKDPARNWSAPQLRHRAHFFKDDSAVLPRALAEFSQARLAVFNFYSEPPVPTLLARRAATGKPWVFWGERPGYKHALAGRLIRRWKLCSLHAGTAPIWGIGQWAVQAYRREFGPARSYVNLPYFSDLSRFQSNLAKAPANAFTFLYSGSLSHRKGVDLLARAFARLAKADPRVCLKIMGQGPLEAQMKEQLHSFGNRVEWTGFKDWHELPATYATANALCVPSRHDGWGLVVPEGLAAGLPVISTDHTGAALDLIQSGVNGSVTNAGSESSLYEAMHKIASLGNADWREMSRQACQSVAEHSLADGAGKFVQACTSAMTSGAIATK